EITWSFNKKKYLPREFPVHNLTFTYTNDIQAPTDKFLTMDKDNTFTSFKWTKVRHMMYFQRFQLLYDREWENNLRMTLQFRHETDTPTGDLRYEKLNGEVLKKMRTTDFTIGLAYRPGTKWVETKQHRRSLGHDYPVYSISHTTGIKGFLGGQYNYNLTEITLERRFWLQSWGKIDAQVKAGIQWNKVPFPLLITPAANLSYFMSRNTFSLIDNMEFLNDRYASLMLSWDINGKILNRIPLIRRLKWREYIGLNVLYGDLTSKNNPFLQRNAASNRLFVFPAQSHAMTNKPYIEAVIGLHNIFRFFHIEYVRRLTYTEGLPERRKWGIRGKLELAF
ncbi:MAG: carboxypeptidase-like regulatory domain-containing protein, partial [Prevotella sp.]|nr:carboxypeptidase-like regulatory domain-containing protein [Prevotella sp.]